MDRHVDKWTDSLTHPDRLTDGQTDEQTDRPTDGWHAGLMGRQTDGRWTLHFIN